MKNLKIDLEPRIILPIDENGDTYIGVYIDDELVSKIAIRNDSASSATYSSDFAITSVQDINKRSYIDIGKDSVKLNADCVALDGKTFYDLGKNKRR